MGSCRPLALASLTQHVGSGHVEHMALLHPFLWKGPLTARIPHIWLISSSVSRHVGRFQLLVITERCCERSRARFCVEVRFQFSWVCNSQCGMAGSYGNTVLIFWRGGCQTAFARAAALLHILVGLLGWASGKPPRGLPPPPSPLGRLPASGLRGR